MPLGLGPFLDQIVTVLLLIAAAVGGFHLYKKYEKPSQPTQVQTAPIATTAKSTDTAEEILQDRYARGEINRTQFQEMMGDLKHEKE